MESSPSRRGPRVIKDARFHALDFQRAVVMKLSLPAFITRVNAVVRDLGLDLGRKEFGADEYRGFQRTRHDVKATYLMIFCRAVGLEEFRIKCDPESILKAARMLRKEK